MMNDFANDIVLGLSATAVVAAGTWLLALLRDYLVRKRFPIAGVYASEYEDRVDGRTLRVKATTTFKQKGRRITGVATNLTDNRSWRLEARISGNGRIHGTYGSANPYDEGVGGFFLENKQAGVLEGVWAGYDSVNKSVEAGRYVFRPVIAFDISRMTVGDIDEGLSILGSALGARYVTREGVLPFVERVDGRCAYIATQRDGKTLGAATGEVFVGRDFLGSLPSGMAQNVAKLIPGIQFNRVGILRSIAVSKRIEGRGVGTALSAAVVDELWAAGSTCIVSVGWSDANGCHVKGVVEGLGMEAVGTIPHFWHEDSLEKGYECSTCGSPCQCEAVIFTMFKS